MNYKIGQEIRVINAGLGAIGCNGLVGKVTNKKSTNGLVTRKGFNIEFKNGQIWSVNNDGQYELIERTIQDKPNTNIHIYEKQPYVYNTLLKRPNGEIFQTQSVKKEKSTYKVIYNGLTTIVIFEDGTKGIAKCDPKEKWNQQIGHDIAFIRANIKKLEKELKELVK